MKAVRLFEFGGPDKLVYGDYPDPDVGPGDVLVKVLATSVSRWDIKYRTGEVHEFYGNATGRGGAIAGRKPFPMPMQLGCDCVGDVGAVGGATTMPGAASHPKPDTSDLWAKKARQPHHGYQARQSLGHDAPRTCRPLRPSPNSPWRRRRAAHRPGTRRTRLQGR